MSARNKGTFNSSCDVSSSSNSPRSVNRVDQAPFNSGVCFCSEAAIGIV